MLLKNKIRERLGPAVAVSVLTLCAATAEAQEGALSREITTTFETVVTATTKAAQKAAAAADKALSDEKSARPKNAKKKTGKSDDAKSDAPSGQKKTEKDAGVKKSPAATSDDDAANAKAAGSKSGDENGKAGAASADGKKQNDAVAPDGKQADPDKKDATAAEPQAADAEKKQAPNPNEWPAAEVELAKARCTQLLKGVDAVTVPEAPFRKGDCGSMAPVRLISIGKTPEISFSPPPVISCDLVVALSKWMKQDVQPAAKRYFGADVIRVESMSDYSCRMAYGRVGNKLSEHGKANALDIRGFITRKGDQIVVLSGWGETRRDVKKRIAEAKAAAAKAEAVKVAAEQAAKERAEQAEFAAKSETTDTALPRKTLVEGLPPKKADPPSLAVSASIVKKGSFGPTANLGGVKNADAKSDAKGKKTGKNDTVAALPPAGEDADVEVPKPTTTVSKFLHETHAAACRIFGTTLGPEANEAHRNHFHVDMAERKVRKICD